MQYPDEKTSVTVTKVWADNNNEAGKRPTIIVLTLTGDTDPDTAENDINKTQTITSSNAVQGNTNRWTYTFNDLPKYNKNGDEIEYTIDEEGTNSEFYQKTDVKSRNKNNNKYIQSTRRNSNSKSNKELGRL